MIGKVIGLFAVVTLVASCQLPTLEMPQVVAHAVVVMNRDYQRFEVPPTVEIYTNLGLVRSLETKLGSPQVVSNVMIVKPEMTEVYAIVSSGGETQRLELEFKNSAVTAAFGEPLDPGEIVDGLIDEQTKAILDYLSGLLGYEVPSLESLANL